MCARSLNPETPRCTSRPEPGSLSFFVATMVKLPMVKQPMLMKPAYICALVVGAMLLLALLSAGLHSSSRASLRRPGALRSLLRDELSSKTTDTPVCNLKGANGTLGVSYPNPLCTSGRPAAPPIPKCPGAQPPRAQPARRRCCPRHE